MSTTSGPGENGTPPQKRLLIRLLLLLPPALLLIMALVLLAVSPSAWGAASVLDVPGWMPPAFAAITALTALAVGAYSLRRTLKATHGDFEVFGLQLAFGVLMFVSGAALLGSLALQVGDESFYATSFTDDDERISATGLFAVSVLYMAFNLGWVWAGAYLYSHAITNMQPNRISARDPREVDGVGELLRERR